MSPAGESARLLLDRAAALAAGSLLDVLPNPPVGCLIVAGGGRVIAEGFHRHYGGPHAEAEALRAAGSAARGAVVHATLEPCGAAVEGKKTPPCAPALRDAGVASVVYACEDPTPTSAGAGPALLRAAGIEVLRSPSPQAEALLVRWRRAVDDPLPWTVAKWAMTLDGKIADARGTSRWITGEEARDRAGEMRARCDAVVVGSRTAALDDPDLRPRGREGRGGRAFLRVVVDGRLRLSPASRLAATARECPVLLACGGEAPPDRRAALERRGVEVAPFPCGDGRVDLGALFRALKGRGLRRVLLEGGGDLHAAALRAGIVRQAAVFVAPAILGGRTAPGPVAGEEGLRGIADPLRLEETRVARLGEDLLVEGFVG